MFKMGCSMARKILAIDGKNSSSNSDPNNPSVSSKKSKDKHSKENEPTTSACSNKAKGTSGDDINDFSKLEADPRIPLNVRQIFKITKSWKAIARTMSKTGTAMFLNLFEQNQDLFYLFDRFQHLKGKELHDSMELKEHAATVMSTLDQSINSLSDYDNFVTYLHSIGELHRKIPDFKKEHFWKIEQPFLKAVKQTLDERCNETIEEIYKIAIKLIIETISAGYGEDDNSKTIKKVSNSTNPKPPPSGNQQQESQNKNGSEFSGDNFSKTGSNHNDQSNNNLSNYSNYNNNNNNNNNKFNNNFDGKNDNYLKLNKCPYNNDSQFLTKKKTNKLYENEQSKTKSKKFNLYNNNNNNDYYEKGESYKTNLKAITLLLAKLQNSNNNIEKTSSHIDNSSKTKNYDDILRGVLFALGELLKLAMKEMLQKQEKQTNDVILLSQKSTFKFRRNSCKNSCSFLLNKNKRKNINIKTEAYDTRTSSSSSSLKDIIKSRVNDLPEEEGGGEEESNKEFYCYLSLNKYQNNNNFSHQNSLTNKNKTFVYIRKRANSITFITSKDDSMKSCCNLSNEKIKTSYSFNQLNNLVYGETYNSNANMFLFKDKEIDNNNFKLNLSLNNKQIEPREQEKEFENNPLNSEKNNFYSYHPKDNSIKLKSKIFDYYFENNNHSNGILFLEKDYLHNLDENLSKHNNKNYSYNCKKVAMCSQGR